VEGILFRGLPIDKQQCSAKTCPQWSLQHLICSTINPLLQKFKYYDHHFFLRSCNFPSGRIAFLYYRPVYQTQLAKGRALQVECEEPRLCHKGSILIEKPMYSFQFRLILPLRRTLFSYSSILLCFVGCLRWRNPLNHSIFLLVLQWGDRCLYSEK